MQNGIKKLRPRYFNSTRSFLFLQPKIYPDLDNTSGAYLKRTIARTMEGKGDKENRDPEVEEEPKNDDKAREYPTTNLFLINSISFSHHLPLF